MKVISEKIATTRKPHHCWGCTREYPTRTEMNVVVSEDGGAVSRAYWCKTCDDYLQTNRNDIDFDLGFNYGDLLEFEDYPNRGKIKFSSPK